MRSFLLICVGLLTVACNLSFNPDLPSNSSGESGPGLDGNGDIDLGSGAASGIPEGNGADATPPNNASGGGTNCTATDGQGGMGSDDGVGGVGGDVKSISSTSLINSEKCKK